MSLPLCWFAMEPRESIAAAPLKLGMNTYSIRALRWNDMPLLDYAASLKLDGIFLQDSIDPGTMDPLHWGVVRTHAAELGLRLETGGGWGLPRSPTEFTRRTNDLVQQAGRAAGMGSPLVRCTMSGMRSMLPPGEPRQHLHTMLRILKQVKTRITDLGVKVAFEVHKDFLAWEYRDLVEEAGRDWVGIYLDTGNPVFVMEHPMTTVETLAPYALTVHLRDSVVYEHPDGIAVQWVPLGEGCVDFPAIVAKVAQLCPQVTVHIKPITGRLPAVLPIWDPAYWKDWRDVRAGDFARFVALAHTGRPYDKYMLIEDAPGKPPQLAGLIQAQQKEHLERSIAYAKEKLGLGVRWRQKA
jgi:sugar phosphate isomerase/epimerase